jgi:hypothetical protein
MHINKCANVHIDVITKLNKQSATLMDKLNARKTIGTTSLIEIDRATQKIQDKIIGTYESYEMELMDMSDTHKDKFRQWISTLTDGSIPPAQLIHDLKQEHNLLNEERLKLNRELIEMQAERKLWKRNNEDLQQMKDKLSALKSHITKNDTTDNNDFHSTLPFESTKMTSKYQPPTPSRNHNNVAEYNNSAPYQRDDPVIYEDDINSFIGFISNENGPPVFKDRHWFYDIYSNGGVTMKMCSDQYIQPYKDTLTQAKSPRIKQPNSPSPPSPPTSMPVVPPYQNAPREPPFHSSYQPTNAKQQQSFGSQLHHTQNPRYVQRTLNFNEFVYPAGTPPKSVWTSQMCKNAEHWGLKVDNDNELYQFYTTLQNMVTESNIFIKPYDQLTRQDDISMITPHNCSNYASAYAAMSKGLFILLDQYKTTIFENYPSPIQSIEAYRSNFNGFGFIKHIMKRQHPHLKPIADTGTQVKPIFDENQSIYTFINAYIRWINDETLEGRTYNDKDKIKYVLRNLDPSTWQHVISKVESKLALIFLDETNPLPFPQELKLTPDLGITLLEYAPMLSRNDLENANGNMTSPTINRLDPYNRKNKAPFEKKYKRNDKKYEHDNDKWADKLEWKIIPGAICPACKTNNHNVYETGCPTLAKFAACKEFYDKTPKDKLEPVKKSYWKYLSEIRRKMKESRNHTRKTLKFLNGSFESDEINVLKEEFFRQYKEEYQEEQYRADNPFHNLDFENDDNDMNEMSSSQE